MRLSALSGHSNQVVWDPALISLNRKSIEWAGLLVAGEPLAFVGRFGPRGKRCGTDLRCSVRRRIGLPSKHGLRCHVGCGC